MDIKIWQLVITPIEGQNVYGILHRTPDGQVQRYEALTTDPEPLRRFLKLVTTLQPEEYHAAELMEDLIASLYLPQEPLA